MERREFIPTARLIENLEQVDWPAVDVITISGSGEPTLASNLGEMISHMKETYAPPIHILTNATLFNLSEVRDAVAQTDVVACKLDAASDEMLRKINRPAPGVSIDSIVEGIMKLKTEYRGRLELQIMFMPINQGEAEALISLIRRIEPAEVQLNTPRRPYPLEWHLVTRGAHDQREFDWPTRTLATISHEKAAEIEQHLRESTDVEIVSVYRS